MRRRIVLAGLVALAVAGPALAQDYEGRLLAMLRGQGYGSIDVSRTLLGRVRIVATSRTEQREIILNPRTGEVLRDYWQLLVSDDGSGSRGAGSGNSGSGNSGSGNSGSGNSGSGSGNSGSGSSGSGGNSGHGGGSDDDGDDDSDDDNSGSGSSGSHG